jgi:di/tricarboxylate transporter
MERGRHFLIKIGNAAGTHSTNFGSFFGEMERVQIVFLAAFPQISYNLCLKNYTKFEEMPLKLKKNIPSHRILSKF